MSFLVAENISLQFGGLKAVDQVNFAVEKGEIFTIIGPNGAGKTSIFNLISRLYNPTSGKLYFEGRDITEVPPHQIAKLGIARTFQNIELFENATMLANLLVGRHCHATTQLWQEMLFLPSVRREEIRQREAVEKIIEFVELERYRHTAVGGLPFGTQKIIGFARALANEPAILLLDEPSAGLNREEREDLARFILRIKHQLGIAMIWIEHDMQMVADLADRIHVLDYGRTLASGPADAVLKDEKVIAAYLGTKKQH